MNKVKTFFNEMFGNLRAFVIDDQIYFSGSDVAKALGYKNERDAIRVHTFESDRKRLIYKACRESRQANICSLLWSGNDFSDKVLINESGLYCLIFGSNLESAEEFKLWVTRKVLPSIRKNGGYISGQENLSADQQANVVAKVKKLSAKVEKLEASNARLQKRRHELIAEKKAVASQLKNRKQEVAAVNGCCDIFEKLYFDLFEDYKELKRKVPPVARTPRLAEKVSRPRRTITVDKEGFVIA